MKEVLTGNSSINKLATNSSTSRLLTESHSISAPKHGGDLHRACIEYGIKKGDWLDLSTGINPNGWPVPSLPGHVWQRLPDGDPALDIAAKHYYQCDELMAVPGSQFAIQALPLLRPHCRVLLPESGYDEHRYAWIQAGHDTSFYRLGSSIEALRPFSEVIRQIEATIIHERPDVVVVINPNNPTADYIPLQRLLSWHKQVAARGGWLIVDEAFLDCSPELSLASYCPLPGLIVLRSLGKFFGLAGIRLGFVLAERSIRTKLIEKLGPWGVSHPASWVGTRALSDKTWQQMMRNHLPKESRKLESYISQYLQGRVKATPLFVSVEMSPLQAKAIHNALAKEGIWTRLFADAGKFCGLRFGLPDNAESYRHLEYALKQQSKVKVD